MPDLPLFGRENSDVGVRCAPRSSGSPEHDPRDQRRIDADQRRIGPVSTTSKAEPGTGFSWSRPSSFHRRVRGPPKNHDDRCRPRSGRSACIASRMTRAGRRGDHERSKRPATAAASPSAAGTSRSSPRRSGWPGGRGRLRRRDREAKSVIDHLPRHFVERGQGPGGWAARRHRPTSIRAAAADSTTSSRRRPGVGVPGLALRHVRGAHGGGSDDATSPTLRDDDVTITVARRAALDRRVRWDRETTGSLSSPYTV